MRLLTIFRHIAKILKFIETKLTAIKLQGFNREIDNKIVVQTKKGNR